MRYQYRVPDEQVDQPPGPVAIDFDSTASPEPEDHATLLEAAAQAHWDEHGGDEVAWPLAIEVYRQGHPIASGEVAAILVPEFSARVLKPA